MTRFLSAMHSCSWVRPWRDPGLFLPYPASSALCDAPFGRRLGRGKSCRFLRGAGSGISGVNLLLTLYLVIAGDARHQIQHATPATGVACRYREKRGCRHLGAVRNAPGRKPMQGGPGANGPRPAEKSAGDSEKGARRHGNVTTMSLGTPVQNALYLGD